MLDVLIFVYLFITGIAFCVWVVFFLALLLQWLPGAWELTRGHPDAMKTKVAVQEAWSGLSFAVRYFPLVVAWPLVPLFIAVMSVVTAWRYKRYIEEQRRLGR